ncbi:MAG: 4Fe-4S dicluster domain-containing protein [Defluviitaleaceae bacterium]|nr:4Fe-4S dicluster domain-containing protein [Defluviitaleaceae bacterium]
MLYKITNDRLPELFARVAEEMPLYLPMHGGANDGIAKVNFARWAGDFEQVDLQTLKTVLSPKGFFFPASEELYKAVLKDNTYEITPQPLNDKPFVLFGVRVCDAVAIKILDGVFLGETMDEFYKTRRDASHIITLACGQPLMTCFCDKFGISPNEPDGDDGNVGNGGDVNAWLKDNYLYWQPQTEKGKILTNKIKCLLITSEEVNLSPSRGQVGSTSKKETNPFAALRENDALLPLFNSNKEANPFAVLRENDATLSLFNSSAWDELHRTCIACGTCTFLCPTCHCYDIANNENGDGNAARCQRHWDACLYPGFTQMAHGNPRPTKKERFRQRYMHKLAYHPQKYGVVACVGCGRCVARCPVNMNILKVARALEAAE